MAANSTFTFFQDNLNLLLTEEEMYSLTETFQRCKVIPGKLALLRRGRHIPFHPSWDGGVWGGRVNESLFLSRGLSEAPASTTAPRAPLAVGGIT